jgi:acyl-CoA synthetase (AMP-forming)/AMP-acid ligase II
MYFTTCSYFSISYQIVKMLMNFIHTDWNELLISPQVQKMSYKIGNYFQSQGFKKGDRVALLMENRPEFPCMWLGLSRVGISFPI